MTQELIHKLLRYLTQGAVIYLLFKYVPKSPMKDSDILIITAIILLVYIIAENCYQMYSGNQQQNCACDMKEGFDANAINNALSQIGSTNSGSSYDLSSIGSALSQITTGSSASPSSAVQSVVQSSVPSTAQSTIASTVQSVQPSISTVQEKIQEDPALLSQMKAQSTSALQQGQQQMQQIQAQMYGQSVQDIQNQINQVAQTPQPVPAQAPQISFPIQSSAETKPIGGYVKNADGTYTVTSVNPISQQPLSYNYTDYNTFPPPANGTGSFEYGYSFLPPANWYPTPATAPVCIPTGPTCPVCPIYTQGTNLDLKEWNKSLSVMPSEQINIKIN